MHSSTRHAALRAAAKVTLSALVSCGGATEDVATGHDAIARDAEHHADAAPKVVRDTAADTGANAADAGHSRASAGDAELAALFDAADGRRRDARAASPCTAETFDVDGTVSTATFECCTSYLEADLVDGGEGLLELRSAPAVKECCASVVAFVDHGGYRALEEAGITAERAVESCCGVLATEAGPPMGPACTPWGPPVPPAMPVAALSPSSLEVA
jgi:hypothetical protein